MNAINQKIRESLFINDPEVALEEVKNIVSNMFGGFDTEFLDTVYSDTQSLFRGDYAGYRRSNTKYHDLNHTVLVTIATTRLIDGCMLNGYSFSADNVMLTLIASLFHDVGLIQTEDETEGSGAKFTIGHEERSVEFLKSYLSTRQFSREAIDDGSNLIRCTILNTSPASIPFASKEIETLGKVLGSADLMAQMADRLYLEKLLLLFKEFEEAKLPGFDSELDLLKKTKAFYEFIAKKRLYDDLDGLCDHMRFHFKKKWNIGVDLYSESIKNNINYLESLVMLCGDSIDCYLGNLRRGDITREMVEPFSAKK